MRKHEPREHVPEYWRGLAIVFAVALIVTLDRWAKSWCVASLPVNHSQPLIPGLIRLTYTLNPGAAFSILPNGRVFFLIMTAIALGVIAWALASRWPRHTLGTLGLAVIAGGALGNMIDRLFNGGLVIDMFELEFMRFAIFNVADIFVTTGGVLFLVYLLLVHDRKGPHEEPPL